MRSLLIHQASSFRLVRQFLVIAVLNSCFAISTYAQILANVTDFDTSVSSQISCYGNTCTVLAEEWLPSLPAHRSVFWRTDDAGLTWKEQVPPDNLESYNFSSLSVFRINKVDQVDSLVAFAVGDSGLILRTFDGGSTWQKMPCPTTSDLIDIDCHSLIEGIIVGAYPDVILTQSEAGWDTVPFVPSGSYGSMVCHSYGNDKYRVFGYNSLYTTLDGWNTVDSNYLPQYTPDSGKINGLAGYWFYYTSTVWGQGDTILQGRTGSLFSKSDSNSRSILLRTYDGGQSWNIIIDTGAITAFGSMYRLFGDSIIALNVANVDDVGFGTNTGLVRLSTDLGATWVRQTDSIQINRTVEGALFFWGAAETQNGSIIGAFSTSSLEGNDYPAYLARLTFAPQSSVSKSEPTLHQATIYPNPASSILNFESSGGVISVLDPLGRSYAIRQTGNSLDVSSLPSGVYFISDGYSRAKFVKE